MRKNSLSHDKKIPDATKIIDEIKFENKKLLI
jgi:hypothetical protein